VDSRFRTITGGDKPLPYRDLSDLSCQLVEDHKRDAPIKPFPNELPRRKQRGIYGSLKEIHLG